MSHRYRGARIDRDKEFEATDARIVTIKSVKNPVLRALVQHSHGEYCSISGNVMSYQSALAKWRREPSTIEQAENADNETGNEFTGFFEEDVPNVESLINEVMLQESQQFNADHHDWYKRHLMSLHIHATCIVAYDGGRSRAQVTGTWCTLSRHVPLIIKGTIVSSEYMLDGSNMHVVDAAKRPDLHGIDVGPIPWVTGAQFSALLREQQMNEETVGNYLQRFFAEPSDNLPDEDDNDDEVRPTASAAATTDDDAPHRPVIVSVRQHNSMVRQQTAEHLSSGAMGGAQVSERFAAVARARNKLLPQCLRNRVTLADLWVRFRRDEVDTQQLIETDSVALGTRLVLFARELFEIRDLYGDREVALTAAARGFAYTIALDRILLEEPEVLCFATMRKAKAEYTQVHALTLLPDLPFDAYIKLVRRNTTRPYNPIVACAVDIYHHILRYDVYGNGKPPTERSFSTGNLFTVFGMADDERYADFYHSGPAGMRAERADSAEQLFDANTLSDVGRFAMPDNPQALATLEQRQMLQIDLARLAQSAATEQFIRALHWLRTQNIVVVVPFIGTGKHNLGRKVDAFYMSDIYELQQRCVKTLADVYERAVKQSMHHSPLLCTPPAMSALVAVARDYIARWREDYLDTMFTAAALKKFAQTRAAAAQDNARAAAASTVAGPPTADEAELAELAAAAARVAASSSSGLPPVSPIAKMARDIARQERMLAKKYDEVRAQLGYDDTADAYADARQGRWLQRPALMLERMPPYTLANGKPYAAEQVDGIERMRIEPISQLSGCGGVGKSETLAYVCNQYNEAQVLCVAFTGQVASNLSMRTNMHASTIHSVLFQHAKFMEARNRTRSYRRHSLKSRNLPPEQQGENFTYEQVNTTNDDVELRAYIDAHIDAHPPFVSPFHNKRVLIVDEGSLVNLPLFVRLLEAMHNPAEGRFVERIIVCGDLDQLPAIGLGNLQSDLAHALPQATVQLTQNHRSHGTELFNLARAIAQHHYELPMPSFDIEQSLAELKKPEALRTPIVTLDTTVASIPDNIEAVLRSIGALDNPALLSQVQILATTNAEVDRANAAVRWLVHGRPELERLEAKRQEAIAAAAAAAARAAPQMCIQRRSVTAPSASAPNADEGSDEAPPYADSAINGAGGDAAGGGSTVDAAERAKLESMLNMQIRPGDRIYLKKNATEVFKAHQHDNQVRKKRTYNTRLLEAVQFYNAPYRLTSNVKCRCRACPPVPDTAPENFVHDCMKRLDLVPERRRVPIAPDHPDYIAYHDKEMPRMHSGNRRMAVFREENGNYIELDVAMMLQPRARWEHGMAMTTHKMQGAQQKHIISICTEARPYITWKHSYTSGTRAQQRLYLLSNEQAFDRIVRRKDSVRRSMFWVEMQQAFAAVLRRYPTSAAAASTQRICPNYLTAQSSTELWNIFERLRAGSTARSVALSASVVAAAAGVQHQQQAAESSDMVLDDINSDSDDDPFYPSSQASVDDEDSSGSEFDSDGLFVRFKRRKFK